MEYMDGEGEIYIRAYTKDQELFIEVEDNGPGMPEEQVAGLLTEESETRSRGSGIGLKMYISVFSFILAQSMAWRLKASRTKEQL